MAPTRWTWGSQPVPTPRRATLLYNALTRRLLARCACFVPNTSPTGSGGAGRCLCSVLLVRPCVLPSSPAPAALQVPPRLRLLRWTRLALNIRQLWQNCPARVARRRRADPSSLPRQHLPRTVRPFAPRAVADRRNLPGPSDRSYTLSCSPGIPNICRARQLAYTSRVRMPRMCILLPNRPHTRTLLRSSCLAERSGRLRKPASASFHRCNNALPNTPHIAEFLLRRDMFRRHTTSAMNQLGQQTRMPHCMRSPRVRCTNRAHTARGEQQC